MNKWSQPSSPSHVPGFVALPVGFLFKPDNTSTTQQAPVRHRKLIKSMLLIQGRAAKEPAAFQKSTAVGQQKPVYQSHAFPFSCSPLHTFTEVDARAEPASFPTSPILPSPCTNFIVTSTLILGESLQRFRFYSQDPILLFTSPMPRAQSPRLRCTANIDPKKLWSRTIQPDLTDTLGKVKSLMLTYCKT